MQSLIQKHCRTLKMGSRIAEGYQDIQAQTHEEFLEKILRMEVKAREVNRKNLLLKQANFDVIKTFEGYLFDAIQIPNSIGIKTIREASFVDQKENLILYGSVGTGKSNNNKRVKFYRTAALVNDLLDAKAAGTIKRLLNQLEKADLLICDEWGYIPFAKAFCERGFPVVVSGHIPVL